MYSSAPASCDRVKYGIVRRPDVEYFDGCAVVRMCPTIASDSLPFAERYPFELSWFPMANHPMWETTDWSRQYAPLIHRYVPQYFDTTLRWVLVLSNR